LGRIKFGVFLPSYAFRNVEANQDSLFGRVREIVLECERLGYDSVWLDDHLMFRRNPILECWTTLSALSSVTTRIRLGTMVTCNGFRNPALLSKMCATVDVISGGRMELAIGAGVQEEEHLSYGFQFPKPIERVLRLVEAITIIKKMWAEKIVAFEGKHYKIKGAVCEPKPIQKPHPPITIGGSGEKLMLKVVAKHADRYDWGYVPSIESYKHKLEVLRKYCREIDRDLREIEKSCWPGSQVLIDVNEKIVSEEAARVKLKNVSMEDFKKANLVGTPEECLQKMRPYMNLGVTYFMLFFGDLPNTKGLRVFAETIVRRAQASSLD
jgi:F420-dependent oxidoreductase-like protein